MASTSATSVSLADYLFSRLRQLGVQSVHGVPGDYNLQLLDYVEPAGLGWVGGANELNAAYAADGYARIKGMAALITTFGVGELSAMNAVAGAYAEFAPVVHIVGTPARAAQESRAPVHHTFNDGEYGRFAQMQAHITVAQESLWDPRTSADQIDRLLQKCRHYCRPVYLQVPIDLVDAPLPAERLALALAPLLPPHPLLQPLPASATALESDLASEICAAVYAAQQPFVLVDGETRPLDIVAEVQALVDGLQWPTWVLPFGKSLVAEDRPYFHGVHRGSFNEPAVQRFLAAADLVLNFGPHHSTTNAFVGTSVPDPAVTIAFTPQGIRMPGGRVVRDVSCKRVLGRVLATVEQDRARKPAYSSASYPSELPRDAVATLAELGPVDGPLTQDRLWRYAASFLRAGDIVLGETGTSGYGVREMRLPPRTRLFTPVTWLSIGYMLPGAQGAALAQRELARALDQKEEESGRTILFIGDGSFQMTAQELSTIIRQDLNVVVFLLNNSGYTIERCIHGRQQGYNDVASWRYLEAPRFFGAPEGSAVATARTWAELEAVFQDPRISDGTGLRMVELFVDVEDAPAGPLLHLMDLQKRKETSK